MRPLQTLRQQWDNHPLPLLLIIALAVRLVAVFFAEGYGMHDDHFLYIENPQIWLQRPDLAPWGDSQTPVGGRSFLYPAINYLLLATLEACGMGSPAAKMLFIRLIHALFSLLVVFYGYRIALRFTHRNIARFPALLLAVFWFQPWLSVRNLVEVACIPFLFMGMWMLLTAPQKRHPLLGFFLAGLVMSIAISIRYQVGVFVAGTALVLLLQKQFKPMLLFIFGSAVSFVVLQGGLDMLNYQTPFIEFKSYIQYNLQHSGDYPPGKWYTYSLLLLGMLIPPVSLFLLFGSFYRWRDRLIILLPTLLFFVFHSAFPNRQERFLFPVVPFFILLGSIGWQEFVQPYQQKYRRWLKGSWVFFWIINGVLLLAVSTMYSKRSRVESMLYLSQQPFPTHVLLQESSDKHSAPMLPRYYLNDVEAIYYTATVENPYDYANGEQPDIILFYHGSNLADNLARTKSFYPHLTFCTTIEPSPIDQLLHRINPKNRNETISIYRTR